MENSDGAGSRHLRVPRLLLGVLLAALLMAVPGGMAAQAGLPACKNVTKVYVVVQATDVDTARAAVESVGGRIYRNLEIVGAV
ncbi:MAG: hypothetical protein QOG64_2349, partial [Acidimicrobiaceae bacterium]|nr:hypothetical protein [Acidimicrobiaceae bacterium]